MLSRTELTHRIESRSEDGSMLPLIVGIFLLALSVFMISANIYALRAEKIYLEVLGEELLSSLYQEIDYQEYFFGESMNVSTGARSWLPFQCSILMQNVNETARVMVGKAYIKSANCDSGRMTLVLSKEVSLPFQPGFLDGFTPQVNAVISGGVQRTRS